MTFDLPPLPYAHDALEPHLSARTLELHHGRHHHGYLQKLRGLIEGTPEEHLELVDLVTSATGATFHNAAQAWNHEFYWHSMTPGGGGEPGGRIGEALTRAFGGYEGFRKEFTTRALGLFGSGYVWLSQDRETGRLVVEDGKDADNPLLHGRIPLLALDVWEHAYYLDHQNARDAYVDAFLSHLVNWRFAEGNLAESNSG